MLVTRRRLLGLLAGMCGTVAARAQQAFRGWPWATLSLQTIKEAGFAPSFVKAGATLYWKWGDGTYTSSNAPTKNYPAGTKKLQVTSRDGFRNVAQVKLHNQSLTGVMPSFALFKTMTRFWCYQIGGGGFTGVMPSFSACVALQELDCNPNAFTGTLPSFAGCTALTSFIIGMNGFSGALPSFAANTALLEFKATDCSFSGTLPSFMDCTLLTNFSVYGNGFSGTLPSFSTCPALVDFSCAYNSFSNALPSFADCVLLTTFYCNNNSFSGALPDFSACTELTQFQCNNSSFSGALPDFSTCVDLLTFRCNNNSFSGALPDFSACTKLTTFYCYSNGFTSIVAGSFATQKSLSGALFQVNALTEDAVDQILADFVVSDAIPGRVNCTVNLTGGTNAHPSVAGLADAATLNASGWTVTYN